MSVIHVLSIHNSCILQLQSLVTICSLDSLESRVFNSDHWQAVTVRLGLEQTTDEQSESPCITTLESLSPFRFLTWPIAKSDPIDQWQNKKKFDNALQHDHFKIISII